MNGESLVPLPTYCPANFWRWREELSRYWMTCDLQQQTQRHLRHSDRVEVEEIARRALGLLQPGAPPLLLSDEAGGSPLLDISAQVVSSFPNASETKQFWTIRRKPQLYGGATRENSSLLYRPESAAEDPRRAESQLLQFLSALSSGPPPSNQDFSLRGGQRLSTEDEGTGMFGPAIYDPSGHAQRHLHRFETREEVVAVVTAFLLDFRSAAAAFQD